MLMMEFQPDTEGAFDEVTTILQRLRDLVVQGANGSLGTAEVGYLTTEHGKLVGALTDAIGQAKFGSQDLVDDQRRFAHFACCDRRSITSLVLVLPQ